MPTETEQLALEGFQPYTPPVGKGGMVARRWLEEEDQILTGMVHQAHENNLEMPPVYIAISERLNNLPCNTERGIARTPKAVEVRYNVRFKEDKVEKVKHDKQPVDEDSLDALLGKLKSTIKERREKTNYRTKYEELKAEHDKLLKDHEKLITTVKRLIDVDDSE